MATQIPLYPEPLNLPSSETKNPEVQADSQSPVYPNSPETTQTNKSSRGVFNGNFNMEMILSLLSGGNFNLEGLLSNIFPSGTQNNNFLSEALQLLNNKKTKKNEDNTEIIVEEI